MKYFLTICSIIGIMLCNSSCKNTGTKEATTKLHDTAYSSRANKFFDKAFNDMAARHPMQLSYLGIKRNYDKWDNISDSFKEADLALIKSQLNEMTSTFKKDSLDEQGKLSYGLFKYNAEQSIALFKYRLNNYPVNQEDGLHAEVPTFLMNVHRIDSVEDAKDYIARLHGILPLFDQLIVNIRDREKKGVIPPKFVFPKVIGSCQNVLSGQPFDQSSRKSDLLADFTSKLDKLKGLDANTKKDLTIQVTLELINSVKPAYEKLIACMADVEKKANTDDGAWKFPDGDNFYKEEIKAMTTTEMTPDEVFALGEKEVARIHGEIKEIMKKVHYKNQDIHDFMRFMATDKSSFYPNTTEGRDKFLHQAEGYINNMRNRLDEIFITKPKAPIVVKRVEAFREKSTGQAFYDQPAPDGSRPGRFYVNLSDMNIIPVYQLEALAYHEGIPGHHMQIAISQELKDVPQFRRYGEYTAYVEGWGLYSERLGKEMGLYTDPYQDFGRLSMELLRAARLVVDPGIHYKHWTREQAIKYFMENTAEPPGECIKAIERYIVWPGQATAYKIGMNKILELREKAKKDLGAKFSIREFHDVVLTSGAVPLNTLEELVNSWVKRRRISSALTGLRY
jgi:uncharacterized protein (DUF885 family)